MRSRLVAMSAGTALLVIGGVVAAGSPALAASWTMASIPNATSLRNQLNAVDAPSATSAWAVGYAETGATPATRPLVARLEGATWSLAATPTLAADAALNGVDGSGAGDVWAVGGAGAGPLTEHWDGSSWSVVASPAPPGVTTATLRGVKALGAGDAWAVGETFTPGPNPQQRTLITHWNGTGWSVVPSPNPNSIRNLMAAVDASAADNVWAIGNLGDDGYGGGTVAGMVLRWNGTAWSQVSLPTDYAVSIVALHDILVLSPNDVWVVGTAFHRYVFGMVPYYLHWNGQSWQSGTIPGGVTGAFNGIAALSPTNIYAVGQTGQWQTLVARWNGSTWSRETTPSPGAYCYLNDAAAAAPGTVWAVGTQFNNSYVGRTFGVGTMNG
jgi:hypothetical protein